MTDQPPLPSPDELLALTDAMAGQRVVVAADLVADRFITGTPKRISREAPVLILSYEEEHLLPGGGANAVANVAALGGLPLPLGTVGEDASGRELMHVLARLGAPTQGVLSRSDYRTPTKTRILGGAKSTIKQQIVRYDIEDHQTLSASERQRFRRVLEEWARLSPPPRVAILSDYGYGSVVPEILTDVRETLGPEVQILGDSRYRLGELAGLDGATPNEEEAEALLGRPLSRDLQELHQAGQELRQRLGLRFLLITRSSHGMSLFLETGSIHLPVHGTDQVADVTGAGDTVIGTFALALAAGASPLAAAVLANYAGGIVVLKIGTATLSREELKEGILADVKPLRETVWVSS